MYNLQKTARLFAILALVLILVGCSTPTVVTQPTADIPKVRTESVQTVVAKLTIEAALNPTAGATQAPVVITATSAPSPTAAAATATLFPTLTSIPTLVPSSGGSSGVVFPTATRRAGPDQAQYITQTPFDGKVYRPGEEFDGTWTFKNIGTTTWNSKYYYDWTGKGINLAKAERYYLHDNVVPGDSVTLVTDMVAPAGAGRYVSYWQLRNDNGAVFFNFYVVIDVK